MELLPPTPDTLTAANATPRTDRERLPSACQIGQPIYLNLQYQITGWVRRVMFTNSKVLYDLDVIAQQIEDGPVVVTTLHGVNSAWVQAREGDWIECGFDNPDRHPGE